MPRKINDQVKQLCETLRRDIEIFPPGRQLPSYRNLLAKHLCSRQTLSRALRQLEAEKVIRVEERSGMFVNEQMKKMVRRIIFFRVDWCCEIADCFSELIKYELSQKRDYHYIELRYPPDECEKFLNKLEENAADVLILWLERLSPQYLSRLSSLGIPLIFFDCGIMFSGINLLDMQEELVGMTAARHLTEKGHRNIAIIITEPLGMTCQKKINGFLDYLHLLRIKPRIISCNVHNGEASHSKTNDFMTAWLKHNRIDFTACFTMGDSSAIGVMKAFQDYGIRIPEDVSIIGCQGIRAGERITPALTTVAFDPRSITETLVNGIEELYDNGSFGIRRVPPVLIERDSVAQISESNQNTFY